ncbi:DUF11 domain-containing protein [Planctomicrobium piriforme]|uniref:Conserved repeat domain-containing protein n=1 Tax=Planctomicrobium piriforme TaxID=1576369 RepID=A0A1I3TBW8_9PLAN|nr:DUF11 domain-containing protein [Planctomicrobium piriforme]SFJ68455.1 conserved repeat domain-containing protein [Planctomicrobium piriforme]
MRRGACLLALLGMTVQSAVGDDTINAGVARPATTKSQAAAALPAGQATAKSPQKFTRSAEAEPAGDELRNYYKELFGTNPPADMTQPATASLPGTNNPAMGAAGKAAVQPATATLKPSSGIVQAEYQPESTSSKGSIELMSGERFSARPFPGAPASPAATPAANPFAAAPAATPAAPATPAAAPAKSPFATTPAEAKAPSQTAMSPAPTTQTSSGRGSVTFSRSTPNAVAARPATGAGKRTEMEAATSVATSAPAVTIEWQKQSEINVGQECKCHLIVKNSGQTTASDVELRAHFPANVRLVDAQPVPAHAEKYLGWQIPELKAGEQKVIEITMVPLERGDISTRADVRFSGSANGNFAVAEPMLDIHVEGPTQVLIGEPASHIVTVTNPGTGIATKVHIEALVPEGLEHARGQRLLMDLGNLNPGESRSVRLALAATKGGPQHLTVHAKADSGLARTAESDVTVIAPMLATTIQGPGLRYLGRQGSYVMTVANDGAAATDNVQLRYKVPAGFEFVSADRGAQYDAANSLVTWFVGRLERGQKSEIKVTLMARQAGEFKHMVRATSEHGAISDAECMTSVEGTSSLAIAVKDLEDPVEVGSQTSYEIRVKNEGSAAARTVGLTCELPPGMTFVSAEGPAEFICERGTVIFRELPEVAAGQSLTFKVNVAAASPGSLRFRAHLSSQSIQEPLTAEEMTKFYGE